MAIDQRELRDALGKFATGICIVTVCPQQGDPVGMTVNSFASLSLDPPLVLWSIQKDSDCWPAFQNADTFGINIIGERHREWSNRYAQRGQQALDASTYCLGEIGVPVLQGSVTAFECRKDAVHDGGDHHLIIGRVESIHDKLSGQPLLFFAGNYGQAEALQG